MTKIQLPIANFAAQDEIFDNPAQHKITAKGRRFGLTKGAANDFIKCALSSQFKRGLWLDTINANIDRYVERYFVPSLKLLPSFLWQWRKQEKILIIKDSYIDFRSADRPENIEGFGYNKYFINEAGIVLKDQYLWNNAVKPMLWDYQASGVVGGTPKGKGVFHELFLRGQEKGQTRYWSKRFTTFDNPFLNHEDIRQDILAMPERVVKQEVYAEFLEDGGSVFQNVRSVMIATPQEPIPGHLYVIGLDLAKLQDWTVITIYDRENNHQVAQIRFNKIDYSYQKEKIREYARKYNNAVVKMDTTGVGEPVYDDLLREGVAVIPYKFTNESKKNLIEKLANWIELGYLGLLPLEETQNEFDSFTYEISSSGRVVYEAPVGLHDDIVMSHSLAVSELHPIQKKKDTKLSIISQDIYAKRQTTQNNLDIEYI